MEDGHMTRFIFAFAAALVAGMATCAYAASTTAETNPKGADECFYKAVNAAVSNPDNATVLMPGKTLKAMLSSCENKTRVETLKYRSVRELKDEDMVPTAADTNAKPQDLVIE